MTSIPPKFPKRHIDPIRTIGATITSCAGAGGAATICATHGSSPLALFVFMAMQVWGICELTCRWIIKLRYIDLYRDIVRRAAEHPDDQDLRTLLVDLASTHLDDVGERISVRKDLK
jgi:hypothetical protein